MYLTAPQKDKNVNFCRVRKQNTPANEFLSIRYFLFACRNASCVIAMMLRSRQDSNLVSSPLLVSAIYIFTFIEFQHVFFPLCCLRPSRTVPASLCALQKTQFPIRFALVSNNKKNTFAPCNTKKPRKISKRFLFFYIVGQCTGLVIHENALLHHSIRIYTG